MLLIMNLATQGIKIGSLSSFQNGVQDGERSEMDGWTALPKIEHTFFFPCCGRKICSLHWLFCG